MNRREALAALIALPAATRITRADLQPDDVIVIECEGPLTQSAIQHLETHIQQVWPGRKVLVLSDGLRLKIVPRAAVQAGT